jgi:putative SOS response-associated peptidase YedK
MCGRFTQHHVPEAVAARFETQVNLFEPPPRYNIAPSQPLAIILNSVTAVSGQEPSSREPSSRVRVLDSFRWGLVPFWAKDPRIGSRMINARAESIAEKPAFKTALARRRCVLPADGFYEWDKTDTSDTSAAAGKVRAAGGTRQPYYFRRRDGDLFGFAGLWEEWRAPDGSALRTCTIVTTSANETVGRVHDRMPAILRSPEDEAAWLDDTLREPGDLLPLMALLAPYPDADMEAYAVSKRVNAPATDDPELIIAALQNSA